MAKGRGTPQAAADILRKAFPERKGILVGEPGSDYDTKEYGFLEGGAALDCGPARRALGREFVGFEKSILDTVDVFLKVYRKELA